MQHVCVTIIIEVDILWKDLVTDPVALPCCRFSTDTDRLTVHSITKDDEGVYFCNASQGGTQPAIVKAGCLIVHGELYCNAH